MSVARGKQGTTVRVGAVASELSRKASYLGRKASYTYWARTHVLMSLPRTAQNAGNAPRFTPQSKVARRPRARGRAGRSVVPSCPNTDKIHPPLSIAAHGSR